MWNTAYITENWLDSFDKFSSLSSMSHMTQKGDPTFMTGLSGKTSSLVSKRSGSNPTSID